MKLHHRGIARAVALRLRGHAQAQNISIATGGTGGVYYPLGGGMAAVLSKYVPGMQATAEVTGGSVANLQLIGTGKPYIALTHGRRGARCAQGPGQVHRQAGPGAHARWCCTRTACTW